ncbi:2Fe-2S iron-sulfur cluster binding domain-containing protein [Shewanella eurypsychrophilus]|uniref:2Fe-2S iron-sulfur cluster binding domain-containing protein n=1 Tax=Shewanella eurypsychrophilus TaxID=2593656 RepID=A0ABX8S4N5_9GAMM|nr:MULTISPECIES: 2Fe-2S iron-sulfur cluster-binding protein [Shewanella]QFU23209.1 2Fe-2S iron-sulfur cluster binding domain-containing protein [Shewanella sp. YLB-09]QXP44801.1 2Fe-2S iron-sulfur cluster binding domain-containing protein [Shewanella eurypsychrophilus]
MTRFFYDGQNCESLNGESVLDTLIREGHQVNYSCKKGACKTCLVKHVEGELSTGSQRGLTLSLKRNHYVCACQCEPTPGLKLKSVLVQDLFIPAQIHSKEYLSDSVVKLLITSSEKLNHCAGQYINLRRFDGLTRSYAIANDPCSNEIELHVRRKYNGQFSDWLFNHASVGESLLLQGPWGHCCYSSAYVDDDLTLIASGTGLGPIYGIAKDAIKSGHRGEINLYHGAKNSNELYQHANLLQLMLENRNFTYHACIPPSQKEGALKLSRVHIGDPFDIATAHKPIKEELNSKSRHRVYLCGEPDFVTRGQASAFLNGVPLKRMHVLSFEYKDLRTVPR